MTETLPRGARVMTLQSSGWGNRVGFVDSATPKRVYVEFPHSTLKMCDFRPSELAEIPHHFPRSTWDAMTVDQQREYVTTHGIQVCYSSGLADETTAGWGELDSNGYWEFPCEWALVRTEAPASDG